MFSIRNKIIFISLIALLLRLAFGFFYTDLENDFWNEYGELSKNIIAGKGYSLFYIDSGKLEFEARDLSEPKPSAYMPPGYTYFILPIFLLNDNIAINITLILVQGLIAAFTVPMIFFYCRKKFTDDIGVLAAIVFAILPELIFSATRAVPTTIFHFTFILFLISLLKQNNLYWILFCSFILITIRSEIILFLIIVAIILFFKKEKKKAIMIILGLLIFLIPWNIRNYYIFSQPVFLTTNSGVNFYRGFNPYYVGVWNDDEMQKEFSELNNTNNLELQLRKLYFEKASLAIKNNPLILITYNLEKTFTFIFYDFRDGRARHPFYLLPWFFMLPFIIYGIYINRKSTNFYYEYIFIALSFLLAIIFFSQARYQTMLKIILIPFFAQSFILLFKYSRNLFKLQKD